MFHVRVATPEEDSFIAKHFRQMWLDLDVPAEAIEPDWLTIVLHYIQQVRRDWQYQAFVAEIDGAIVGSASCQQAAGLYPQTRTPQGWLYLGRLC
jgi:hypothetical protein